MLVMMMAWAGTLAGPFLMWRLWRLRTRPALAVLVLLAIAYPLGVWTVLIEPKLLVVRQVSVETPAWTAPPIRIAVVSDTHVGGPHVDAARIRRIADRISTLSPDVVVFVGDYVAGHAPAAARSPGERAEIAAGLTALARARARLGQVAVLGNHDWWYDGPTVEAELQRAGVPVLENDAVRIQGGGFWIAGVADHMSKRTPPSPSAALQAVPAGEPVILLSHWPDTFAHVPPRVALTIAAHSHCGQVNLPLIGRPILPSPGAAAWPCGLYDQDGRKLLVTGGIGTSALPVRFRAPPEIVIVTLRGAP